MQEGYVLPLHGQGGKIFRPSQILGVLKDINETDEIDWTPLHSACVNNNVETVKKLLELCCNVNAKTDKGQTALHLAIHVGSSEIVMLLLDHEADANVHTIHEHNSPLHMACEGGYRKIAYELLEAEALVDEPNKMQRTPLHLSALSGRSDIGSMLLRAGANPHAMDIHGWNARQLAELRGHRPFQELMVRATMEEKMAVIKELPVAPWHCELWDEVVASNLEQIAKERKEQEVWDQTVQEVAVARDRAVAERQGEAEQQRLVIVAQRKRDKIARDKAREELAAQILGGNASLTKADDDGPQKSPVKGNNRAKPPPGLMGMSIRKDKYGNVIES